jgi:hypothetical protein
VHPVIDLLFCCGGAVWIAAWLYTWAMQDFNPSVVQFYSLQMVLLSQLLSNPHTSATWVRIYGDRNEYSRFRFYALWLALGLLGVGALSMWVPGGPASLLYLYLLWVVPHYTSQVYGIAMLYCARWDYRFSTWERYVFKYAMLFTALYSIVRKLTWKSYAASHFLGLQMPFWGPLPEWMATISFGLWAGTGLLFLFVVADKFYREGQLLPLPVILIVASCVVFILGTSPMMGAIWLFVPAFFHGSQYLMVSGVFHFGRKRLEGAPDSAKLFSWEGFKYWGLLAIIGNFIYVGFPRAVSELGFDFVAAAAASFAIVNFHHFLTDAAIWKLRDPKTREVLMYG